MPIRHVEIFSAGCPICEETCRLIQRLCNGLCEVSVLNVSDASVAERARALGLRSFPAVVVDGELVPFDVYASVSRALAESEWLRQLLGSG